MEPSPIAAVASATCDDVADDDVGIKRSRRGEKFTSPLDVNLHANDFEWSDLLQELSDGDRSLYKTYRERCHELVRAIREEMLSAAPQQRCSCCLYALGHEQAPSAQPQAGADNTPRKSAVHVHDPQSWERHYTTNKMHFPVKNYIIHAFPSLVPRNEGESHLDALRRLSSLQTPSTGEHAEVEPRAEPTHSPRVIMEAGCGTGSVVHPLMKLFPTDRFVCHDVSGSAVAALVQHPAASRHVSNHLLDVFVLDLSSTGHALEDAMNASCKTGLGQQSVDVVMLVFVLSAMPSLRHMVHVLRQLRGYLKPTTGRLCFRDYGALDHNFFRFHRQQNMLIDDSLNFLKGDGTEQFFFDTDTVVELFALAGLQPARRREDSVALEYHCNRIVNRKNGKRMDKVFINGEFEVCPLPEDASQTGNA